MKTSLKGEGRKNRGDKKGRTTRVRVGLDIPKRILMARVLVARNLLLLESPIGKFNLMREKVAPRKKMPQLELRPQRFNLLLRESSVALRLVDLDDPVVVGVTVEPFEPVRRDFVLVVHLGDGSADVVRVKLLVRRGVVEDEGGAVEDGTDGRVVLWIGDGRVGGAVQDEPEVVVVAVRVEGDLLLCEESVSEQEHGKQRGGKWRTNASSRRGKLTGESEGSRPGCARGGGRW